jgi:LPXTG-motif cell wall-anchored protein
MANRWLKRASAAAAAVGVALVFGGGTAWAVPNPTPSPVDVHWVGNGTNYDKTTGEGTCEHVGKSDDLNPGQGQEGWLFILTSPSGSTSQLSFAFDPASALYDSTSPVDGDKKGNGSIHFVVYSSIGAKLASATATNGTANSVLTVSHCTDGPPADTTPSTPPPPTSSISSDVRLANNNVIDDSGNHSGTAPADVHDAVTVTVTGLDFWSGTIHESFYDTNNCDSKVIDSTTVDVSESTKMPVDILEETGLPAGEYSYSASFVDENNDILSTDGICEPFRVVAGPPTSSTTTAPPTTGVPTTTPPSGNHLPTTGVALTGYILAGLALIAGGVFALMVARRRHDAKSTTI